MYYLINFTQTSLSWIDHIRTCIITLANIKLAGTFQFQHVRVKIYIFLHIFLPLCSLKRCPFNCFGWGEKGSIRYRYLDKGIVIKTYALWIKTYVLAWIFFLFIYLTIFEMSESLLDLVKTQLARVWNKLRSKMVTDTKEKKNCFTVFACCKAG